MQPTEQDIIKAYNIAKETGADSTCKVLEALFPDVDFKPKDNRPVTERIKTFEDARRELGENHPFVETYNVFEHDVRASVGGEFLTDIAAYLKIRIIVEALNEGWKPQFTEDEYRWYPWYYLYTDEELAEKSEEWKQANTILDLHDRRRVVGRSSNNANASGGLVYANAGIASSFSSASYGARLALKSEALAAYAGKQFIEIYADMNIGYNI